jgi:hypothetical protein
MCPATMTMGRSSAGVFVCGIVDGDGTTERIAAGVEAVVAGTCFLTSEEGGARPA